MNSISNGGDDSDSLRRATTSHANVANVAAGILNPSALTAGSLPFSPFRSQGSSVHSLFTNSYANTIGTTIAGLTGGVAPTSVLRNSAPSGGIGAATAPQFNVTRPIIRQYNQDSVGLVLGGVPSAANNTSQTNYSHSNDAADSAQKLKVEDALSYLDQVKVQFANRPHVYSDFLDIMKDFKSQTIDTPGVIQRVSTLFRGRPSLIVGFNTFLPPGFRIEVNGERISICTPNGEQSVITEGDLGLPNSNASTSNIYAPPQSHLASSRPVSESNTTLSTSSFNAQPPQQQPSQQQQQQQQQHHQQQQPQQPSLPPQQQQQPPPQQQHAPGPMQRQAIEINHAIAYVNKIKNRFQSNPEVYKQFLDILYSYQKEQRDLRTNVTARPTLSESEVYQSVARLFSNEPDLLREFSQFLPDATCGINVPNFLASLGSQPPSNATQQAQTKPPPANAGLSLGTPLSKPTTKPDPVLATLNGTIAGFAANNNNNNNTCTPTTPHNVSSTTTSNNNEHSRVNGTASATPLIKKEEHHDVLLDAKERDIPRTHNKRAASPVSQRNETAPKYSKVELTYEVPLGEAANYGSMVEYEFFDKVRKAACHNDRAIYENFLRCLALYNQDLVSKMELLDLVQPFLSKKSELMQWLKDFMGCDDRSGYNDLISHKSVEERAEKHINSDLALQIDFSTCKLHGVSYRALPASYAKPKCTGRTQLCNEVLNDTWVSFPSWSEGDTGCVSSKKTTYEEFIYRTEDERFELDIVIETNKSAILVLEFFQKKVKKMTREELENVDDSLCSRVPGPLFVRALRRIYGDKSHDIVQGIKRNPVVAVPLVLKRLKAKDQEWREAQKNFNQIWRDSNDKYYLKSLDHQGQTSRQNDFKQLRSKTLLNQIETLYDERRERAEESTTGELESGPHLQIRYPNDGDDIVYDVADLLIHHVRRQTGIQKEEKARIKRLIKQMLPDLFGLDREQLSDDDDAGSSTEDRSEESDREDGRRSRRVNSLKHNNNHQTRDRTEKQRPAYTNNQWRKLGSYQLLYGTNAWYVFLRLHQIMVERLHQLRTYARQQCNADGQTPAVSAAEALRVVNKSSIPTEKYYSSLIQAIKNLLDGQIDMQQYEDTLREMFTIKAFLAFTMDKFIPTMVKQLQTIVSEETNARCLSAAEAFKQNVTESEMAFHSASRHQAESDYQQQAEQVLVDQNCFKIHFLHDNHEVTFELLDTDSPEDDDLDDSGDGTMSCYVKHYERLLTEFKDEPDKHRVAQSALMQRPRFLARNTRSAAWQSASDAQQASSSASTSHVKATDGLQMKIDAANGAKVCYVAGTTHTWFRRGAPSTAKKHHNTACQRRSARFGRWHTARWKELVGGAHEQMHTNHVNWMHAHQLSHCRTTASDQAIVGFEYLIVKRYMTEYMHNDNHMDTS